MIGRRGVDCECKLTDHPTIGDSVIEHYRITVIGVGGNSPESGKQSAQFESRSTRIPGFVINPDERVCGLDNIVWSDRYVRIRRGESCTESGYVIRRAEALEC